VVTKIEGIRSIAEVFHFDNCYLAKMMSELSDKEMVPPWEEFPTYKRYSLGWRMGYGEDYFHDWLDFIATLPDDYDTRIAYLSRHRPAPINWANLMLRVLYPSQEWDKESDRYAVEKLKLLDRGSIAYDAAYQTWLQQQSEIAWPWQIFGDNPEDVARYCTREFWFFSRQYDFASQSGDVPLIEVPAKWENLAPELLTGKLGKVDPAQGLFTLAQMLCTVSVLPPWLLGLSPDDFTDSFEMNMGYVDAFRLWMMSAFDDDVLLTQILSNPGVPTEWSSWIEAELMFD
jgi:hypothetical protein